MKYTLTLFLAFLYSFYLISQETFTQRTILKSEPFHFISGQINICLEKQFSRRSALEFGAGFIFSDYSDLFFAPDFVTYEQMQITEGYVLRTNYRRYKEKMTTTQSASKYFQVDFFIKVIDYTPLDKGNYVIHGLKDVIGISVNWGKPKITSKSYVYDFYAGFGTRLKFYHTDKYIENQGQWTPTSPYEVTKLLLFIQTGIKIGKIMGDKKPQN